MCSPTLSGALMRAAFAAMGYQLDQTANVADLSSVPSSELLRVLADRLGVSEEEYRRGNTAAKTEAGETPADETQADYAKAAQSNTPKTRANRARRREEKYRIPGEHQGQVLEGGA